ncbi:MAG: hypothetical protein COB90_09010 [Hyphomicrobiales bacterium]|nr:MAG: hypothetical protein COB90_09010 [Hyphomicrobiales bacterium]
MIFALPSLGKREAKIQKNSIPGNREMYCTANSSIMRLILHFHHQTITNDDNIHQGKYQNNSTITT